MASERKDVVAVISLKVPYEEWAAGFHSDSANRAAHGAVDETRTKAVKVDDKTAAVFFYNADMAAHRAYLNQPGRKEIVERVSEGSKLYIAAGPPPASA